MNASLLSVIQTEPWSLVLLGAVLFGLSSIARRKSAVPAAVSSSDPIAVARGSQAPAAVLPRMVERAGVSPRPALRPMLESGLKRAV